MAEVHSYKVDDQKGVPDRLIREFLNECEEKLGRININMVPVVTGTATLLTIIVTKSGDAT